MSLRDEIAEAVNEAWMAGAHDAEYVAADAVLTHLRARALAGWNGGACYDPEHLDDAFAAFGFDEMTDEEKAAVRDRVYKTRGRTADA